VSTRAINNQPELYRFFIRCFHRSEKQKPERFTIHHVQEGVEREQIYDINEFEEGVSPEDLTNDVLVRAQQDAKAFAGTQKYVIRCYPEGGRDAIDREFFWLEGALFDRHAETMSGPSEGPSERGLTSQLMRHLEAQARTYHSTFHSMMSMQRDIIQEQRQMIQDMSRERLETVRIAQDLLDRKQEREIHLGREKMKDGLLLKGVEALNLMFPTLAFKMLGGKKENGQNGHANGQRESEGESGVKHFVSFLQALSDDQKLAIFGLLHDEQKMVFGEIAQTYQNADGKFKTGELLALDWAIHGMLKGLDENQFTLLFLGKDGAPAIFTEDQAKAFRAIYEGYGIRDKRASLEQGTPGKKEETAPKQPLAPDPPEPKIEPKVLDQPIAQPVAQTVAQPVAIVKAANPKKRKKP
jgi:hypothetical protein